MSKKKSAMKISMQEQSATEIMDQAHDHISKDLELWEIDFLKWRESLSSFCENFDFEKLKDEVYASLEEKMALYDARVGELSNTSLCGHHYVVVEAPALPTESPISSRSSAYTNYSSKKQYLVPHHSFHQLHDDDDDDGDALNFDDISVESILSYADANLDNSSSMESSLSSSDIIKKTEEVNAAVSRDTKAGNLTIAGYEQFQFTSAPELYSLKSATPTASAGTAKGN